MSQESSHFVSIKEGRFFHKGRPYSFIGANLWYGAYLARESLAGGRARLRRELDDLKALGMTNLRLLAGSESCNLGCSLGAGITTAPGCVDEELLRGLDFCLAEMGKREMTAVLFLTNFWHWSGGMPQLLEWSGAGGIPDTENGFTWGDLMAYSSRFYSHAPAMELLNDYIRRLTSRRNTVTGGLYLDDPTIMSWQLANEPRPGQDGQAYAFEAIPAFHAWIDTTARLIHACAPNQLVSTGNEGAAGCLFDEKATRGAQSSSHVDYVTAHLWLKNWGWLKAVQFGQNYEEASARGIEYLRAHARMAESLGKPLVMEEFGLARDGERLEPGSPTLVRDHFYQAVFEEVITSSKGGGALQGANLWAWGGEARPGVRGEAGSFFGDPFCEPQGWNSIYNTDAGTLAMIRACQARLGLT